MNNEGNIWLALLARINQWTETDIARPNELYQPLANRPYIWIQPVGLDFDFSIVGENCGNEYRGILNISVMTPLQGWSYANQIGLAGRVCDHFANYKKDGVHVFRTPRVIGSPYADGPHNRLDVEINWRCFA